MEYRQILETADRLKELKDRKKDLDAQSKQLAAEIEELDFMLSDAMAEEELDKFTRNGSTFYLSTRTFASPVAGMKDELMDALKKNGYGDLVTETVNANTLAAFCKEQMAENDDHLPLWLEGNVHVYEKVSVGIRKA